MWARNRDGGPFELLKKYPLAATSGSLGPKRAAGDYQVPEGFYEIDRFNPKSWFHLSLGLNYPNAADRALGEPRPRRRHLHPRRRRQHRLPAHHRRGH